MDKLTLYEIHEARVAFWGAPGTPAPKNNARRERIVDLLKSGTVVELESKQLCFQMPLTGRTVCEKSYLRLIGLAAMDGTINRQYSRTKNLFHKGTLSEKPVTAGRQPRLTQHAKSYIRMQAAYSDTYATPDGVVLGAGDVEYAVRAVPYISAAAFYLDYEAFSKEHTLEYAKRKTFSNAFFSMKNEVRLSDSKGSFQTCDVCNNCDDLLKVS